LVANEYRFLIETELGRYSEALAAYRRLGPDGLQRNLKAAEAINDTLLGSAPIAVKGEIANGGWDISPAWRVFGLTDVDGQITDVTVRCDLKTAVLRVQPDVEWTVPDSWGACKVVVHGADGAHFTLMQFHHTLQEQHT
jgi:hypothetical protein